MSSLPETLREDLQQLIAWRTSRQLSHTTLVCVSRDQLSARLPRIATLLQHPDAALITALLGEIGNNCFDHNLGQWRGTAGCWFAYHFSAPHFWAILADQGQGIRNSLQHVLPKNIQSDQVALEFAFDKRVSGRSPEQRGNGLKFVRQIINCEKPRALLCYSGAGMVSFGAVQAELTEAYAQYADRTIAIVGTTSVLQWELPL